MADEKIKSGSEVYEERLAREKTFKQAFDHIGGKRLAVDQAVKIVSSPGFMGDRKDVMAMAREIYAFMVEA